jgi:hypothetical protein
VRPDPPSQPPISYIFTLAGDTNGFERERFIADLAIALSIDAKRITITKVDSGSVIVTVSIADDPFDAIRASDVLATLEAVTPATIGAFRDRLPTGSPFLILEMSNIPPLQASVSFTFTLVDPLENPDAAFAAFRDVITEALNIDAARMTLERLLDDGHIVVTTIVDNNVSSPRANEVLATLTGMTAAQFQALLPDGTYTLSAMSAQSPEPM